MLRSGRRHHGGIGTRAGRLAQPFWAICISRPIHSAGRLVRKPTSLQGRICAEAPRMAARPCAGDGGNTPTRQAGLPESDADMHHQLRCGEVSSGGHICAIGARCCWPASRPRCCHCIALWLNLRHRRRPVRAFRGLRGHHRQGHIRHRVGGRGAVGAGVGTTTHHRRLRHHHLERFEA